MPPVRMTYRQIADDLAARIRSGEFAADDGKLPSYTQLAALYSCSVSNVQRALALLRDRGLVAGHQGVGVWVVDQTDAVADERHNPEP